MKIAVIGSGISGLSAAYYLSKKFKVDLFEKENHFGGHAYTIDLDLDNKKIPIDIGFIVFNHQTYPNLISFFKELQINIEKSNMSFSVKVHDKKIEYCGKGLGGIFCDKKNLLNFKFIKMFFEIITFYKKSEKIGNLNQNITLGDYLEKEKMSEYFSEYHIVPMVSAIWSMPPYEAKQMPLKFFIKFFQNHGLFKLRGRPQWYTVSRRSKTYVKKVLENISGEYFKNYPIISIKRINPGVQIFYGDKSEFFNYDKVVIATHADQALNLIENPTIEETEILSEFKYKKNIAYIHSDETVMPKNKKAWSSWNSSIIKQKKTNTCVTYWLNLLENLETKKNIFLTLNPNFEIKKKKIYKIFEFTHPYYNQNALDFQTKLSKLQNKKDLLFCGSYFGYGFHEDGINSSISMMKALNEK